MLMTIVSYLVAILTAVVFFHVFVHAFDMVCLLLFCFMAKARKRHDQPALSQTGLMLQSTAKGFCTNVLASLIGIGIITLFGRNYLAFPLIYLALIVICAINSIKFSPPLRVKVELFILLGNLLALIGVYSVLWVVNDTHWHNTSLARGWRMNWVLYALQGLTLCFCAWVLSVDCRVWRRLRLRGIPGARLLLCARCSASGCPVLGVLVSCFFESWVAWCVWLGGWATGYLLCSILMRPTLRFLGRDAGLILDAWEQEADEVTGKTGAKDSPPDN